MAVGTSGFIPRRAISELPATHSTIIYGGKRAFAAVPTMVYILSWPTFAARAPMSALRHALAAGSAGRAIYVMKRSALPPDRW